MKRLNIYENNMSVMKEYRPNLYKKIKEIETSYNRKTHLLIETARNGESVLEIMREGEKVYFNSRYNPTNEAKSWCQQFVFHDLNMKVFFFGIGNGVYLKEIWNNLYEDGRIYVYEPSLNIFMFVLNNVDISDILQKKEIYICVESINEKELYIQGRSDMNWGNMEAQVVCCHPKYDMIFPKQYITFLQIIRDINMETLVDHNTGTNFANQFADNCISNMQYICGSNCLNDFIDGVRKKTAIIVAAGPSLDKNIQLLKMARGRAFILAVDRAVQRLLDCEVHFDAMVSVDPIKPLEMFGDNRCRDIPMFCGLETSREIMDYHHGKKILACYNSFLNKIYVAKGKKLRDFNPGGSVATFAFSICEELGFESVILVGQDLAYAGKYTHAGGVSEEIKGDCLLEVEGIDGKKVRTRRDWINYLRWYEKRIAMHDSLEVIDATEGGALIKGTKVMSLEQAITMYCDGKMDYQKYIIKKQPTFNEKENIEVLQEILHIEEELDIIRKQSRRAMEACKWLKEHVDQQVFLSEKNKKLEEVQEAVNAIQEQNICSVVENYAQSKVSQEMGTLGKMDESDIDNKRSVYKKAESVYSEMVKSTDKIQGIYNKYKEAIKSQ